MTETHSEYQPTELALIRVSGADARSFLHAQTTQDIDALPDGGRCLAAWLNAKGRVRALFEVIADDEMLWLALPADNRDYVITELGRYVLRANVMLEAADAKALPPALTDINLQPSDADVLDAIRRGIPEVTAAQREQYIPRMLNLDKLDAISFSKGCYPGQEIVARAANLGEVKRRLRHFKASEGSPPTIGDAIVTADGKPASNVNRVAVSDSGFELLAVVPVDTEQLALADDGRALTTASSPY